MWLHVISQGIHISQILITSYAAPYLINMYIYKCGVMLLCTIGIPKTISFHSPSDKVLV